MWHKFKNYKPKKDGWYICTVEVCQQQRYVMLLYWYSDQNKFIDNNRQNIFDTYRVLNYASEELKSCSLCDRTSGVIYWKKQMKPKMTGFKKEEF